MNEPHFPTTARTGRPGPAAGDYIDSVADRVLQALQDSTWSDGSALVDVDETILRDRVRPLIVEALESSRP